MSRTCSTSRIQREVIQANGQSGSNQRSAVAMSTTIPRRRPPIPHRCGRHHSPVAGCPHAWNQPHPGRGRHPRRPPGRHGVHRRPGPDVSHPARGDHLRLHHHARVHLPRARGGHLRRPGRPHRPRDHPQRAQPRPRHGVRRQPHRARRPRGDQHARRDRGLRLLQHRRGPAPLRRPGRRQGLPLQPVRGARRPPRLHHLRAARPEVRLHLQRHRPVALGRGLQRRDARARGRPGRAGRRVDLALPHHQADVDLHHRDRGR